MTISSLLDWSTNPNDNVDVDDISLVESQTLVAQLNNITRAIMAQIKGGVDYKQVYATKSGDYTAVLNDNNAVHRFTAAATVTLTAAATLGANWHYTIINASTGTVTIDGNASETINGATTFDVPSNCSASIICTGTGFVVVTTISGLRAALVYSRTVITATGAYTFTVPDGITRVTVKAWGGGAGGGGAAAGTPGGAASGGGGAGKLEETLDVTPGDVITGFVGAGGTAGTNAVNGGDGGDTTVVYNGVTYTAGGGEGGLSANAGVAQSSRSGGATTNGGVTSRSGNVSAQGFFSNNGTTSLAQGGNGGASPQGGNGGNGGTGNGNNGVVPGGGGAGAGGTSGSNQTGGAGARGEVWFEY